MNKAAARPGPEPLNDSTSYTELTQTPDNDARVLSEREQQALQLWDQAEELRLERALLEVQRSGQFAELEDLSDDTLEEHLITAEREALEARSRYLLRNKIVQSVLVTNPILKAVHGGANTSSAEQKLLPLINERDILAMVHGALATKVIVNTAELSDAERENIALMKKNKVVAQELLQLANDMRTQKPDDIQDAKLRNALLQAQDEVRAARKEWRIMKSIVAGTIVGSGVDWADDETLTNLVLDDEEELG